MNRKEVTELINYTLQTRGPGQLTCSTLQWSCVFRGQWCYALKLFRVQKIIYQQTSVNEDSYRWSTGQFSGLRQLFQLLTQENFLWSSQGMSSWPCTTSLWVSLYKSWVTNHHDSWVIVISAAQQDPGCKVHICHKSPGKPNHKH